MKKLLIGISSGIIFTLLSMGIGLITAPIFLKVLSREEFGVFYLINNMIIWTGLLNVGLRGSFKLQLAQAVGKGENTAQLASTSFFIQCIVALIVSIIGFTLSFFVEQIFTVAPNHSEDVRYAFIILSLSFSCSLISNGLAAILSVHNKDAYVYTTRSILLVLQTFIAFVLLYFDWKIIGLSVAALLSEAAFFIYMLFLVGLKYNYVNFRFHQFNRQLLINSFSLGKWFFAGFLAQLFIRHIDLFLIEKLAGVEQVAAFIITSKLYMVTFSLLLIIIKIITPQLIRLMQSSEQSGFATKMVVLYLKLFVGITIIAGTIIFIFNSQFIAWWVGSSYYLGYNINLALMLSFLFTSLNLAGRSILLARSQLKTQKISALTEGILHLTLASILGIIYGVQGIVIGIALSSAISCVLTFTPIIYSHPNAKQIRSEIIIIICYILISILLLLNIPEFPSYTISLLAVASIIGIFLTLSLKDIKWIIVDFFKPVKA